MFNSLGLGLTKRKRNKLVTILLSSTSAYAILDFEPDFVLDFKNSVYKTNSTDTTLSSAVTHARAGNATMVDSDGLLKWAPHNLLIRSEQLNLWSQSGTGSVVVDNAVAPDGTTTAATFTMGSTAAITYIRSFGTYTVGDIITFSFWARSDNITSIGLGINGGASTGNNPIFANLAVTSTWSLLEFEFTILETDVNSLYYIIGKQGDNPVAGQIGDVEIWHPHSYRSDLGGMVNNPAQSTGFETYVPTTSSSAYAPRVGHHVYNGSAWVNEGILHESEARTNAISTSEVAPTAYSSGITKAVDSSVVSPSGGNNVEKFTLSSANEQHYFGNHNHICTGSGTSTYSIFTKGSGHNLIRLRMANTSGSFSCDFNLSTGQKQVTSVSDSSVTGAIESMGNGWWRCSITYAAEKTNPYASVFLINAMDAPLSNSFLGDGTSGVYVWGSQYEAGATPSSYIPTSGSAVTRAAETLTVPAANLPYSSTNMSIQMDGKMTYADNSLTAEVQPYRWQLDNGNYILLRVQTINHRTGQISLNQRATSSSLDSVNGAVDTYTPDTNVPFNVASRHGSTFLNGAHEGTLLTANTTPTALPDLSSTNLELGQTFMGTIGKFRMWNEDLTDTGITEAST
jgi:hypothetical protein